MAVVVFWLVLLVLLHFLDVWEIFIAALDGAFDLPLGCHGGGGVRFVVALRGDDVNVSSEFCCRD